MLPQLERGKGDGGKNDTANFMSGLVGAIPPLNDLTKNVGIELPEFLGKLSDDPAGAAKLIEKAKSMTPQQPQSSTDNGQQS